MSAGAFSSRALRPRSRPSAVSLIRPDKLGILRARRARKSTPAPASGAALLPAESGGMRRTLPMPILAAASGGAPTSSLKKDDERKARTPWPPFREGLVAEDNVAEQEKMIEAYRKTLDLDPTYAELAVKLAYELARRDDPSSGVQILKTDAQTIKAAPKEADALHLSLATLREGSQEAGSGIEICRAGPGARAGQLCRLPGGLRNLHRHRSQNEKGRAIARPRREIRAWRCQVLDPARRPQHPPLPEGGRFC